MSNAELEAEPETVKLSFGPGMYLTEPKVRYMNMSASANQYLA